MGEKGLDEAVGEHFGRVPNYTIYDTETEQVEVIPNTSEHMGGRGLPPEVISKANVDIMLCGGLGRRAIMLFEQFGIMVYVGAYGTVRDAIQMWKDGRLDPATDENACRQHAHRGERHGNGCEGGRHHDG
jgi:predicted Fe-Mo cluster-binding NifX family protein